MSQKYAFTDISGNPGGRSLEASRFAILAAAVPGRGGGYFRRQPGEVMVEIYRTEEKDPFKIPQKDKKTQTREISLDTNENSVYTDINKYAEENLL